MMKKAIKVFSVFLMLTVLILLAANLPMQAQATTEETLSSQETVSTEETLPTEETVPAEEYLSYQITNDQVTITDCNTSIAGALIIPDTIEGYPVTGIGQEAFYECRSLTSVTIPDSVKTIGVRAFYLCSKLTSVTIGSGIVQVGQYAFYYCSSLTSVYITDIAAWCQIDFYHNYANPACGNDLYLNGELITELTIPEDVTQIDNYAFYNCDTLTSLTIPDSVTKIGTSAFSKCSKLTAVTLGSGVTQMGQNAFYGCSALTSVYITDIAAWCHIDFYDNYANPAMANNLYLNGELVTELIVPEGVTRIGDYAFYDCDTLTSLTIPDSVTKIGTSAFPNCSRLTSVDLGNGVAHIGKYAFNNCEKLSSLKGGNNLKTVGKSAFYNCRFSYTVLNGIKYLGNEENPYLILMDTTSTAIKSAHIPDTTRIIYYQAFMSCGSLTQVTIPDSVTDIGDLAFCYCSSLTSLTLPENLTNIGKQAFYDCSAVPFVQIPGSVNDIGENAFSECSGLTAVTIGNGVKTLGAGTFSGCTGLTSVTVPDSVISMGGGIFNGCSKLTKLTVPFVGTSRNPTPKTAGQLFGYIFGSTIYTGGTTIRQWYASPTSYDVGWSEACVPNSLRSVTVTGGTILNNAFSSFSGLTSVTLADGITSISDSAFANCKKLTAIHIPDSITTIGSSAFKDCDSLTSVILPDGVVTVDSSAFANCDSLTTVRLPDTLKYLNTGAFSGCTSLASVRIPTGISGIGYSLFYGCTSLTSVVIPGNISAIWRSAFSGCTSLSSVYLPVSVYLIDEYAFNNTGGTTIYYAGDEEAWAGVTKYGGNEGIRFVALNCLFDQEPLQPAPEKPDPITNGVVESWGLKLEENIGIDFQMQYTPYTLCDCDAYVELAVGDSISKIPVIHAQERIYTELAAAQMSDQITLAVVAGDGTRGESQTYSIRQYALYILNGSYDSTTKQLMRDVLQYGAAAQNYFGYNTDNLANESITGAATEEVPETAEQIALSDQISTIDFYGASFVYRDRIAVRFYFTGDVTGCTFAANGNSYTPVSKDGMHYVEIANILPQDLDQQITLTATDTDGDTLSVSYSPMNYMVRMNEKGSMELQNLLKALFNYHLAAKALQETV